MGERKKKKKKGGVAWFLGRLINCEPYLSLDILGKGEERGK